MVSYGDFSFKHRFAMYNHILCRQTWETLEQKNGEEDKSWPFRPINKRDIEMMELVNENMDFLETCPLDSIVMPKV